MDYWEGQRVCQADKIDIYVDLWLSRVKLYDTLFLLLAYGQKDPSCLVLQIRRE